MPRVKGKYNWRHTCLGAGFNNWVELPLSVTVCTECGKRLEDANDDD